MPLKITRRPFTSCPFRWSLSTWGISTGEGDCSNEQCLALNGDFLLDFSACDSRHGKLVWDGDCETGDGSTPDCKCPKCQYCKQSPPIAATIVSGLDADGFSITCYTQSQPVDSEFFEYCPEGFPREKYTAIAKCVDRKGVEKTFCSTVHDAVGFLGSFESGFRSCNDCEGGCLECGTYQFEITGVSGCVGEYNLKYVINGEFFTEGTCQWGEPAFASGAVYAVMDSLSGTLRISNGTETTTYSVPGVIGISPSSGPPGAVTGTLSSAGCGTGWPTTITIELYSVDGKPPSHDVHDRIRSKWHLEWDVEEELWTLRSFNKVDYPVYQLSDADPCTGETKTLLLADKGDAADGCGVAPSEVTITRVCPPDRVGKSALLEDRKPNGATGKTKRQCGCDCQDEVDDRRSCASKCTSTEDEGCGNINPAPDDITCRYPEAINCCENTAGLDVPCAYVVEFECDLFFDIEDVRHKIAAKQVVMRRECYFEDGCEFVAAGPESSTGGSPVMDTDGFPGAQPVCSSCADLCLTGCTWSAWTVAECPPGSPSLCPLTADKTKCLEFRWYDVQSTSYTAGDVAATLAFTSETIDPTGRILWVFTSEDGEWVATIYPNTLGVPRVWCAQGGTYCGSGSLSWNNAPDGFPNTVWPSNEWMTETFYTDFVCSNNSIADSGIFFDGNEFGSAYTTLRMYWIDCP